MRRARIQLFNALFVDPTSPIMPAPDLTENKSAGNRSSRNDHGPKVPDLRPSGFGTPVQHRKVISAGRFHFPGRIFQVRRGVGRHLIAAVNASWSKIKAAGRSMDRPTALLGGAFTGCWGKCPVQIRLARSRELATKLMR
jgi:hypothetical protein